MYEYLHSARGFSVESARFMPLNWFPLSNAKCRSSMNHHMDHLSHTSHKIPSYGSLCVVKTTELNRDPP
jgi:hypothetical protein